MSSENKKQKKENQMNNIQGKSPENIQVEILSNIDRKIFMNEGKSISINTKIDFHFCGNSSIRYRMQL